MKIQATLAAMALLASPVMAQDKVALPSLGTAFAVDLAQETVAACAADGYNVAAAVTDRAGILLALVRAEGAGAHTADAATAKAYTSAASRNPTSGMAKAVQENPGAAGLVDIPGFLVLAGGVPVKSGAAVLGAIGVGGAPGGNLDEACAVKALEKLADRLNQPICPRALRARPHNAVKAMRSVMLAGVLIMNLSGASAGVLSAVERGDVTALETVIASGGEIDLRNGKGQTPLLVAVWRDDLPAARRLIEAGADVNAKDNIQDSPYLVAGAHGRVDILRLILAHGADLKSTNRFGGTALIPAAEKGHPEAVDMLIAAGVDVDHVNDLGWTALLEAVILTDGGPTAQRIVRSLLAANADRNIPDRDGRTALDHARSRGFDVIAAMLEDR